jgi:hypothetical protein
MLVLGVGFVTTLGIVLILLWASRTFDPGQYLFSLILSAVLVGVAFPLKFYGLKLTKTRRRTVSDFIDEQEGRIAFCSHSEKRKGDIVVPVFCGFLFDGHNSYVLLEPAQDRSKALEFIQKLRELCLANNSWHLDFFINRLYASLHHRKARRAFAEPENSAAHYQA